MEIWAKLLRDSPYIAMILALGAVVVYLYRRKETATRELQGKFNALQTKYTEDLVKATGALQDLTAEYLKQSFADSAGWQDRYKTIEESFRKHTAEDIAADHRIEVKFTEVKDAFDKQESRIKEHVDRAVERVLANLPR